MGLKKYIAFRTIQACVTLFMASVIVYALMRAAPGDPILAFYGVQAGNLDEATLQLLRHQYGLDQPVVIHYFAWLSQVLQGNLGRSYIWQTEVSGVVGRAAMWTLELQGTSLALGILIAVPIGVVSAVKQFSKTDYAARLFGVFFYSMPWFWLAAITIIIFSLYLNWFPSGGAYANTEAQSLFGTGSVMDLLWHLTLPAFVLATNYAGLLSRIVRSAMLEVLRQEYILTARSKGIKERIVIYNHAFRNALLPSVTVIGLQMGAMFGGAATVETVFSWPGMGRLIVDASFQRDYSTMMGAFLLTSSVIVFAVLITDLVYSYLDPRIRY
jgi:peptide/nickel transport system permease protein